MGSMEKESNTTLFVKMRVETNIVATSPGLPSQTSCIHDESVAEAQLMHSRQPVNSYPRFL